MIHIYTKVFNWHLMAPFDQSLDTVDWFDIYLLDLFVFKTENNYLVLKSIKPFLTICIIRTGIGFISTGKYLQDIKFPASKITSACFGGPNLDELYVTCCNNDPLASEPLAGSIFKVSGLGVKGRAPNNFKGWNDSVFRSMYANRCQLCGELCDFFILQHSWK